LRVRLDCGCTIDGSYCFRCDLFRPCGCDRPAGRRGWRCRQERAAVPRAVQRQGDRGGLPCAESTRRSEGHRQRAVSDLIHIIVPADADWLAPWRSFCADVEDLLVGPIRYVKELEDATCPRCIVLKTEAMAVEAAKEAHDGGQAAVD
jgi:hypothetical protein